jgi:hypothetical protein
MLSYRLKYLFFLVLVVAVALMWWRWYSSTELTAERLLQARVISETVPKGLSTDDAVESLGLREWALPFPNQTHELGLPVLTDYFIASSWHQPDIVIRVVDPRFTDIKMDKVLWQADWTLIENRRNEERTVFLWMVIVSLVAGLVGCWLIIPRRKPSGQ